MIDMPKIGDLVAGWEHQCTHPTVGVVVGVLLQELLDKKDPNDVRFCIVPARKPTGALDFGRDEFGFLWPKDERHFLSLQTLGETAHVVGRSPYSAEAFVIGARRAAHGKIPRVLAQGGEPGHWQWVSTKEEFLQVRAAQSDYEFWHPTMYEEKAEYRDSKRRHGDELWREIEGLLA